MTIDFNKLKEPFKNVSWRIGRVKEKDKKYYMQNKKYPLGAEATFLAYIDARDVYDRLDEVVGPGNWQNRQEVLPNGSMKCTLLLKINNEWISKEDGAGIRTTEVEKSAYSDAVKRAAVLWGVGRYLYNVKTSYVPIDFYGKPTAAARVILDECLKKAETGLYQPTEEEHEEAEETKETKIEVIRDKSSLKFSEKGKTEFLDLVDLLDREEGRCEIKGNKLIIGEKFYEIKNGKYGKYVFIGSCIGVKTAEDFVKKVYQIRDDIQNN